MTVNATYYAGGTGYTPADMMQREADWVSPGVLSSSDLVVAQTTTASMNVTVSGAVQGSIGGNAWLPGGYRVFNDALATLAISAADATNPRIDLVAIGIDTTVSPYAPQLKAIKGTAAASPVAPSLPAGFVGIALAQVRVNANATSITNTNITDVRAIAGLVAQSGGDPIATSLSDVAHKDGTLQTNLNADMVDGIQGNQIPLKTTSIINYYVNVTSGLDTNDGLTSGTAFKTVQKAINSIPEILNHSAIINIADGTYLEDIIVARFYGEPIFIKSSSGNASNCILKSISIKNTTSPVSVINIKFNTTTQDSIYIYNSTNVGIQGCLTIDTASSFTGIHAVCSIVSVSNCTLSNKSSGIWCATGRVFSNSNTGTGNVYGLFCSDGGTIGKWGTQPSGTTAESSAGGGVVR